MLKASFILFLLGTIGLTLNKKTEVKQQHPFDLKRYKKKTASYFPLSVNCPQANPGDLNFKGRVIAHGDFLSFQKIKENPEAVVERQLKYIDGFVDHIDHSEIRFVPHREKKFKVLSIKKIKYPTAIFLDKVDVNSSYYPQKSLNRWYQKGKESTEISYEAKVKVTRCTNKKEIPQKYNVTLPLDPYLAYWYVPKKQRVEMIYHPKVKMVTTPCASKTMAQLRHPNMYWNVWKPKASDCKGLLKDDAHIQTLSAYFTPLNSRPQKIQFSHLKNKGEIKISIISGLLHPIETSDNLKNARVLLKNINSIDKIEKEKLKDQDTATLATLTFMHLMNTFAKDIHWNAHDVTDHLIFKTKGLLTHSNKPVSIQIYLGPTTDYQKGRRHWDFLANALRDSDFIFYSGHAAMGYAFSLENLKKYSTFKNFKNTPQNQFFAILSCSSLSYFGDDFIGEREKLGKTTDFLLTGFDDHSYQLTPSIIQYIDLELSEQKYSLKSILTSHLRKGYDVHLTRN